MAEAELDHRVPPGLHLVSAFRAMEPTDSLISLARECDGGFLTERVQRFVWRHCISEAAGEGYLPYLKKFVKKLISEIESSHGTVLDELYEEYAHYMTSMKEDNLVKGNTRVSKCISFLFPDGSFQLPSDPKSSKLVVPLHCSLNMLEGDTGCCVWPASLYLSEFILSFPELFSNKSCFEVGSGVGLVGICLSHVKASEIILSDGDLSTLANMKLNLELNQLKTGTGVTERFREAPNIVKCICLPWESATEKELLKFTPDLVVGADIIYDPSCLPHLVRVLAILLNQMKSFSEMRKEKWQSSSPDSKHDVEKANGAHKVGDFDPYNIDESDANTSQSAKTIDSHQVEEPQNDSADAKSRKGPAAYIASVIRNIETFNYFLQLAQQANLVITDLTETLRPLNLLPYMQSYNRSSIRLFAVTYK